MTIPPIAPEASIGPYVPVTTASGILINKPMRSPFTYPAKGSVVLGIRNPIAKRLVKAATIATFRFGNSMNSIGIMSIIPKARPARRPALSRDIYDLPSFFGLARIYASFSNRVNGHLPGLVVNRLANSPA